MSLIVIAGVLATGLLSVGAYRLWLKATADDDDVEVRTCTPACSYLVYPPNTHHSSAGSIHRSWLPLPPSLPPYHLAF